MKTAKLQPWNQNVVVSSQESTDKPRWCAEKQRHHSFNKGLYRQGYGIPSSQYSCVSWTVEKAECQRIDTFELWCWRKLLKVPWTSRRSNKLILREINPEYSQEGLMLKLKLPGFGHLMTKTLTTRWLVVKVPDAGKHQGQKEKRASEDEMARWHHLCNEHELGKTLGYGEGQGDLVCCSPWSHKTGHDEATEQQYEGTSPRSRNITKPPNAYK